MRMREHQSSGAARTRARSRSCMRFGSVILRMRATLFEKQNCGARNITNLHSQLCGESIKTRKDGSSDSI